MKSGCVCEACGHHTVHITPREVSLLKAVGLSLSNKEIGSQLRLAESTVKNRLAQIAHKFNITGEGRIAMLLTADVHGIIDLHALAAQFVDGQAVA